MIRVEHNATTGEIKKIELSQKEIDQLKSSGFVLDDEMIKAKAEAEAKATARASALAKLAALGLTETEIAAL